MFNETKKIIVVLFGVTILMTAPARARQTPLDDRTKTSFGPVEYLRRSRSARQDFRDKNYDRAAETLKLLLKANPADGKNWSMLASSLYELKRYAEAIPSYRKSAALGFLDKALAAYQIARCYSLLGDKESALRRLNEALRSHYRYRTRIDRDDAFKSLRDDARFAEMAGSIKPQVANRVLGWAIDLDYLISEVKRVHYRYSREPLPPEFLSGG
ncbi:MAG TPA: tetratricopeptide repeat protein [Pyrinomonadaceae bacterium]|jgi:tetratricopeptide (TPR) repeat protein